jgi:hypothetical protein
VARRERKSTSQRGMPAFYALVVNGEERPGRTPITFYEGPPEEDGFRPWRIGFKVGSEAVPYNPLDPGERGFRLYASAEGGQPFFVFSVQGLLS